MICPKCGAQLPDGTKFCPQCGGDLSAAAQTTPMTEPMGSGISDLSSPVSSSIPQPVNSSVPQPVSSSVPQPSAFGAQNQTGMSSVQPGLSAGQSVQPSFGGQPQPSPFGGQPSESSYIPPQTYGPVTPVKKSSKMPIIIGACVAVVAVFLILLFTVIIPNLGGGGLEHKWTASEGGVTIAYDFKNNTLEAEGMSVPIEWEQDGDKVTVAVSIMGITVSEDTYTYKISGRTLTLTDEDGNSVDLTRAD